MFYDGMDRLPPSTPVVSVEEIVRRGGCGLPEGCGGAIVRLRVSAEDNLNSAEELGYLVESDRKNAPYGTGHPIEQEDEGIIMILMQEKDAPIRDLELELSVYAVDRAGNVSTEPAVIKVRDETGGCALGKSSGGDGAALALALLLARNALVMRRSQRSTRR
jgi:hypothetical protein